MAGELNFLSIFFTVWVLSNILHQHLASLNPVLHMSSIHVLMSIITFGQPSGEGNIFSRVCLSTEDSCPGPPPVQKLGSGDLPPPRHLQTCSIRTSLCSTAASYTPLPTLPPPPHTDTFTLVHNERKVGLSESWQLAFD